MKYWSQAAHGPDAQSVIEVEHLTKEYRLGAIESLRSLVFRALGRPASGRQGFKALDDVSFSVRSGEVLGLIGHNGAGKSTLLKHLCNVVTPSSGRLTVRGRVAPLIEVGAGLIGEMTGRENIYLNATILGLRRSEIRARMDEIIEFSELEQFIDTPIKRYSSGMQARLAFAIATSVESEILIVDEVLSVGDLAFQKKCFERMDELIRRGQRTVLFVSHNLRQVERLCTRVILLEHGRVMFDGDPAVGCEMLFEKMQKQRADRFGAAVRVESSGEVTLLDIEVCSPGTPECAEIISGAPLQIRATIRSERAFGAPSIIIGTHTPDFIYINAGNTAELNQRIPIRVGTQTVTYTVPSYPVVPGVYLVRFSIYDDNHRPVFLGESLKHFVVAPVGKEMNKAGMRLFELEGTWG